MTAYKAPSFQERTAAALAAKERALQKLRAKPAPTEAELAARAEREAARQAKEAEKRQLREEAKIEKQRKAEEAKAASNIAPPPPPTAEELKAARDARYAARKKRKG